MNSNKSFQETSELFISESDKLKVIIENALQKSEKLSISEIVQAYYQIINVNALIQVLKQSFDKTKEPDFSKTLTEVQNLISEKFNEKLHPRAMSQLTDLIENSMNNLKSAKKGSHGEKSKEDIEREAKLYEELRQTMSAKEFVEQYDKGLEND